MVKSIAPKLCEVAWMDAYSPAATDSYNINEVDKVHRAIPIHTIGWVLRHDRDGVTIAGENCGDGDYRNLTFIPYCLIIEVKPIGKPRSPKKPKEPKTDARPNELPIEG